FAVADAVPAPTSPNPDGQTPNPGVRKLVVRLTGAGPTTIAVTFTGPGDPVGAEATTPIGAWTVPGTPTADVTRPATATPTSPSACDPVPETTTTTVAPPSAGVVVPAAATVTPVFTG
ncbi:MAG: hypothetical protein KDB33_09995, partial [Acidimicrobiales bacterium]|nr:hypothetical protein [Acidimicrobiales bacterium]